MVGGGGGATDLNLRDRGKKETKYFMGMAQAFQNKTVKACLIYLPRRLSASELACIINRFFLKRSCGVLWFSSLAAY